MKLTFNELVARYKSQGVQALEQELPLLCIEASKPDAPPGLRYFVVDLLLDSNADEQALKILLQIEAETKLKLTDVHHNLVAFSKWNLHDEAGAVDRYKLSLELNPANLSSLRGICILLNGMERDAEALPYAKRWMELVPKSEEAIEWGLTIRKNCK